MPQVLLIDAYSQIFRLFYAIRNLTNAKGEPTNALFGMARLFLQLEDEFPCDYGAMVFDHGKCVRRTALLPAYKAQRPPMPEELRAQVPKIRLWAQAFGWSVVEREGFEADDLLAGIAGERHGETVRILTGDKDLGQLVKDGEVLLLKPGNSKTPWEEIGEAKVQEKFGVTPSQLKDYLALVGDTADNIPGIPGCGPKTAARLLQQFGCLEGLVARLGELPAGKIKDTLKEHQEHLKQNQELVRLDTPLPDGWKDMSSIRKNHPDWNALADLCQQEGFKAILSEIQKRKAPQQLMLF